MEKNRHLFLLTVSGRHDENFREFLRLLKLWMPSKIFHSLGLLQKPI